MKKLLAACFLIIPIYSMAEEVKPELRGGKILEYLSPVEMGHYFAQEAKKAHKADERGEPQVQSDEETTFVVPIFKEQQDAAVQPQASVVVGTLNCNISAHHPHATRWNDLRVVKSKSSGSCYYSHIEGAKPPSITWNLFMILTDGWYTRDKPNIRNGLSVNWSQSSAFVVHFPCINGRWRNWNAMVATLPEGYVFRENGGRKYWWPVGESTSRVYC